MINFFYETDFILNNEERYSSWAAQVVTSESCSVGEINYIFCNDEYLHKINLDYLQHDDYTDIISFDYSEGSLLHGDIYISIERVLDNSKTFNVSFDDELLRVRAHGLLHYCGFKDKSNSESIIMRDKEEEKIALFHVKQ